MFQRSEEVKETYKGGRIEKTGKYIGVFEHVYQITSKSGSKAIHFDFVSNQGESNSFDIYYWSAKSGENIDFAMSIIQEQIMNILRVNQLKEKPNTIVQVYDFASGNMVDKSVVSYPGLENKSVGIVFQETVYKRQTPKENGEKFGSQFIPVKYFDAATGKTAYELVNKKEPEELEKYLAKLAPLFVPKNIRDEYEDRDEEAVHVNNKAQTQQPTATYMPPSSTQSSFDEFDDSIPF